MNNIKLNDESLEEVSGGNIIRASRNGNLCPRCHSGSYTAAGKENGVEHRVCNICGREYDCPIL